MYTIILKVRNEQTERRPWEIKKLEEAKRAASFICTQMQFAFDIEYCKVLDKNGKIVWRY